MLVTPRWKQKLNYKRNMYGYTSITGTDAISMPVLAINWHEYSSIPSVVVLDRACDTNITDVFIPIYTMNQTSADDQQLCYVWPRIIGSTVLLRTRNQIFPDSLSQMAESFSQY